MRLRVTFSKAGALRYTGHLDLQRIWERACRRASLPLSYSHGFHPQARISMAAALPLGFLGQAELVDLYLDQDLPEAEVRDRLQASLPPGMLVSTTRLIDMQQPALQTLVISASYEVQFLDPVDLDFLSSGITRLLTATSLPRKRRERDYDLRPLIESLSIKERIETDLVVLSMQLAASPSRTGRPEEVLAELGLGQAATRITRIALLLAPGV